MQGRSTRLIRGSTGNRQPAARRLSAPRQATQGIGSCAASTAPVPRPRASITASTGSARGTVTSVTDGNGQAPAELRRQVTSPGGTTQAAIETFQAGGLETLVARAVHAARQRAAELATGAGA